MKLSKEDYFTDDCIVEDDLYYNIKNLIICPLCHKILKNPFMCDKCQATYCKQCLEDYSNLKRCPKDEKETQFKHCIMISDLISKLKYECKNCKKEVTHDEIKAHLEENCKSVEVEKRKTLAEIITTKRELIKIPKEKMVDKKVDNSFTSNLFL